MYTRVHVEYPIFFSDFKEIKFSAQIFEKYSNSKFHENLAGESRVVSRVRMEGQTDMKKLIVAFRNFANSPKNGS